MVSRRSFLVGLGSLSAAAPLWLGLDIGGLPARAATSGKKLYVAPNGQDGEYPARGTIETPFATLPYAFARANPGDTILMRGGTYRGSPA
jgi:hypothetical protein